MTEEWIKEQTQKIREAMTTQPEFAAGHALDVIGVLWRETERLERRVAELEKKIVALVEEFV